MLKRKILFFIFFLSIPLSSCSLKNNNTKIDQIENQKTPAEKKISNVIEAKDKETLDEELKIKETTLMQNNSIEMRIENDQQIKSFENYSKNFYLNFSFGYSSLKNYDVYNTSTNKAIWDDRYTELGRSIEIGIGYDFGKNKNRIILCSGKWKI